MCRRVAQIRRTRSSPKRPEPRSGAADLGIRRRVTQIRRTRSSPERPGPRSGAADLGTCRRVTQIHRTRSSPERPEPRSGAAGLGDTPCESQSCCTRSSLRAADTPWSREPARRRRSPPLPTFRSTPPTRSTPLGPGGIDAVHTPSATHPRRPGPTRLVAPHVHTAGAPRPAPVRVTAPSHPPTAASHGTRWPWAPALSRRSECLGPRPSPRTRDRTPAPAQRGRARAALRQRRRAPGPPSHRAPGTAGEMRRPPQRPPHRKARGHKRVGTRACGRKGAGHEGAGHQGARRETPAPRREARGTKGPEARGLGGGVGRVGAWDLVSMTAMPCWLGALRPGCGTLGLSSSGSSPASLRCGCRGRIGWLVRVGR